jgi:hypothetical protein
VAPASGGALTATVVLLVAAFLVGTFAFSPSAHAATTVSVPIDVTVAEASAHAFTWTISGSCAPSPSSGTTGATVTVTMNSGCGFSLNVPADGTTQRDRFVGGTSYVTTLVESSCATSPCTTISVTAHVEELLTITSGCFSPTVSVSSPTSDGWYNYGTSLSVSCDGVWGRLGTTGQRATAWKWDATSPTSVGTTATFSSSAMTMNSGHTLTVTTVTQYEVSLDAGAKAALYSITNPTITGDDYWYDSGSAVTLVLNGVWNRAGGTGTRVTSYSLNGETALPVATKGTLTVLNDVLISTGEAVTTNVVNQYQLTLDLTAGTALNTITATPIPGDNYWYDSGTTVSYTGNGVYQRSHGTGVRATGWYVDSGPTSPVATSGAFTVLLPMGAPHTIHVTTTTQYEVQFSGSFAVSSATPPTLPGDSYWYDSGTVVSISLEGAFDRAAGTGMRMTSVSVDGGPSPSVLTTGSVNVLSSVSMYSTHTIAVTTVTQYQVTLNSAATAALVYQTPPTVQGDSMWYDSGTSVVVTASGVGGRNATTGYRLASYNLGSEGAIPVASSGTVTLLDVSIESPEAIYVTSVVQYHLSVNGGSGITYSAQPPISGDTGWYDVGTPVSVSSLGYYGSNGGVRMRVSALSIDGAAATPVGLASTITTPTLTMDAPHSVTFSSVTQYLVSVQVTDATGARTLAPESVSVSVGGNAPINGTGLFWVDSGSTVQVVGITWENSQVGPANEPTMTVTAPATFGVKALVYPASVVVRDSFGASVGGATVDVTLANGTEVRGQTDGSGTYSLGLIPLGPVQGTVSNMGFSSRFSGNAASDSVTTAGVPLSYVDIFGIVTIAAVLVVAFVLVRRFLGRRSTPWPRR